ncbi:MAG: hypothetical protein HY302_01365 [Opitutae bacterium]|nr:hypothetical protein [Opitutae bacterium]
MSTLPADFWTTLPLGAGVQLLTRDENGLAAFDKPAGVLAHPNEPKDEPRALLTCHYDAEGEFFSWRDAANVEQRLYLLNRLDSATSGVILTAASKALAEEIKKQFAKKQVKLRVQCATRHLPIVGDQNYGNFNLNRTFAKATQNKRLFLHSLDTSFSYDFAGRTFAFKAHAPLPRDFTSAH